MGSSNVDGRLASLTGVRGIAALIVFVSHFSNMTGWLGYRLGHGAGQIGVMLFFILSSFLMYLLYFESGSEEKEGRAREAVAYLAKRFARIYPLVFLSLLVSYFIGFFDVPRYLNAHRIDSVGEILAHLLLLKGNGVLWTISVEFFFYLNRAEGAH
jgi:peptidoglycan/LPS O-acetylase OafA/YrhL